SYSWRLNATTVRRQIRAAGMAVAQSNDLRPVFPFRVSRVDLPDRMATGAIHHLWCQYRIRHGGRERIHAWPRARQLIGGLDIQMRRSAVAGHLRIGGTGHGWIRIDLAAPLSLC